MKWFKHMTNTRRREDIAKLLNERSGTMLYGIYCLVLETVAERMDGYSDCCEVTYPIKEWAEIAHVDVRTFTRFLQVCSELADFMYEKNYKLVTIRIDNLAKLQDETTRKFRTKREHNSGLDIEQTGLGADAPRPTGVRCAHSSHPSGGRAGGVSPQTAPSAEKVILSTKSTPKTRQAELKEKIDGLFNSFWDKYPRKTAKKKCRAQYNKLYKQHEVIMTGLSRWLGCDQWSKDNGQYIPYPASFLSKEHWTTPPDVRQSQKAANNISTSTEPIVIYGGRSGIRLIEAKETDNVSQTQ